ncbi:MAG: GNAT family N-acetyltransferase [Acidobacteriota bacterium]|nr:GNAT family N-acetyltransferase [Acidobacteriota bacterium]MDH3530865.1 GNAT family N-acetyltransferase [Acidobacteriota bacterium]
MELIVRKARKSEARELTAIALSSKAFWGYSVDFMESCKDELEVTGADIDSEEFAYNVACLNEGIKGFYAVHKKSGPEAELEALFVEPGSIGTGIGRLLIEHAMQKAIDEGYSRLLIQGDPNSEGFYLAAGGKKVGERESESIPGRFLPLFRISLAEGLK